MSPVEPSVRTVNSSSTQPFMPRLRVVGRKLRRHVFDALQRIRADHAWRAARRCARVASSSLCGGIEVVAGEGDGARLEQPGIGGARDRRAPARRASRADRRRRGPGARCATAGLRGIRVDQLEQVGLGAAVGRAAAAGWRPSAVVNDCASVAHLAGARADQRVLQRAADGGHLRARPRRRRRRSPASARCRRRCRRSAAAPARVSNSFCSARVISASAGSSGTIWRAASR